MKRIDRIGDVHICFALDKSYVPYFKVSLFSLLKNRNRNLQYDIIVLYSGFSLDDGNEILSLAEKEDLVSIRLIDVSKEAEVLAYEVGSYLSVATNYRLLLFSEMFLEYDRIVYLDCDTITEGDIAELFYVNLNGMPVAAVEETGFRQMSFSKKAVFINGKLPYNVDNYRTDALCMKHPESYFNAGVLVLDLKKCRERYSFADVAHVLRQKKYHYNDQDTLNILFDGQVQLLDYTWNYQNNVDAFCRKRPEIYGKMYADVRRSNPCIIHYVSSYKPWNTEVMHGERYRFYEGMCNVP